MSAHELLRWIADAAIRGGLALSIGAGVAWILRGQPAALRAGVWRAGLLVLLLVPTAGAFLPRWSLPVLPSTQAHEVVVANESRSVAIPAAVEAASPRRGVSNEALLVVLWLTGVLVMGARLVGSHVRLSGLLRKSVPLDAGRERECRAVQTDLELQQHVLYRTSNAVSVPLACGWARPVVLLPASFNDWSPVFRRRVLVHELSHLQRHDPLWRAVGALARVLHWYHPLVWLGFDRLRSESEHACDEAVVRSGQRPSDYAETLLTIATMPAGAVPQAATAMVRRNGLESRIEAILAGRGLGAVGRRQRVALEMVAGVVGLVLAIAQPVAGGSSTAPSPTPRAAGAESNSWITRALSVEPVAARYENDEASIVRVLGAKIRIVDHVGSGSAGLTMPEVVLENRDRTNTVASVRVAFDLPTTRDRLEEEIRIAPGGIATLSLEPEKWSALVRRKESAQLLVHVVGYTFTNGVSHGAAETPAPPAQPEAWTKSDAVAPTPRPYDDANAPSPDWSGPSVPAKLRNLADAPVVIVEARTPQSPAAGDRKGTTWLPRVKIQNRSSRQVVALRLRFKAEPVGHGVSGYQVTIEPGATVELRKSFWIDGRAEDMTVQLLGVRFRDGTVLGSMGSRIDARWPWVEESPGAEY
jgi:beta-lactamase regulating signal transducer with metallopeptidase domain